MSDRTIATKLHMSRRSLTKIARPASTKPDRDDDIRLSEADIEHIRTRHATGRSIGTIAKEIGRSDYMVRRAVARFGLNLPNDPWREAMIARMNHLKLTTRQVASRARNVPADHVREYLARKKGMPTSLAHQIAAALGMKLVVVG